MTESKLKGNEQSKVNDEIQFVPNMSSLHGGGLELWMNALHSAKDVHCNLTTENGLLKITLVDPIDDNNQCVDKKISNLSDNNSLDQSSSSFCNDNVQHENTDLKTFSEQRRPTSNEIKNCLSFRTAVKNKKQERSNLKKKCKKSNRTSNEVVMERQANDLDETVDTARSTVVVTVSPKQQRKQEEVDFKYVPPDPDMFPCSRAEWFQNALGEPSTSFDEPSDVSPDDSMCINTTALAADLRLFLKHHSIPLGTFSKNYLKRSQGTLSDLLNHPKPWVCLSSRGRSIYTKMIEFLSSKDLLQTVEKYKQSSVAGRRGPPTNSLPPRLMQLLAEKKMPDPDHLLQVSRDLDLGIMQLRSYCRSQLERTADSFDVIVEFEDEQPDPVQADDSGSSEQQEERKVILKSGFQPRSFDKHICPVHGCGLILGARLTLKHHLLTHSGLRPHRCGSCDKAFVTLNNLRKHEKCHRVEPKISKRRAYTCYACSTSFKLLSLLRNHVIKKHANEVMRDNCRLYSCRLCQKLFKSVSSVHIHQKSHARGRTYECQHCKKRFFTSYNCKRHMRSHTDVRSYFCPRCPERFNDSKSLTNHMRLHTGDRPYQCKGCKKRFTQQSSLQSHLLLHSDSRPFLCAICGKGFRQRSNLRVHENRHHSNCTFVCGICEMAFTSSSDYHRHCLTHNSERRFACSKCSVSYTRFSYLTQHVQKVHGVSPFKCDKCGCELSSRTALLNHRCDSSESRSESGKEANVQLFETVSPEPGVASTILQVFPNAVCCISPLPNRDTELSADTLPPDATPFADPSFVAADQSSFPVALIRNNVFVLTSPTEVGSSVIVEQNDTTPNESAYGSLSKIPLTPGKVLCATMQDDSDPNMHSVVVAPDDYEHLQEGASYVMVNVADDVTVLSENLSS